MSLIKWGFFEISKQITSQGACKILIVIPAVRLHGTGVGWEANGGLISGKSCLIFTQDSRIFSLISFPDR